MIRLVLFLLVIGLALYTVARVMAVFRQEPKQLPPPDEENTGESAGTAKNDSAADSDDSSPKH